VAVPTDLADRRATTADVDAVLALWERADAVPTVGSRGT
jgi:hypothetical protein